MAPRKAAAKAPIAKTKGKSGSGKYSDDHPELQTNYWKFQVMTYDSAASTERNEIDFMLQSLQSDITDGKHGWVFVIKQLSDVFAIMAYDKLKASRADLDSAAQCEEMAPLFDNCIQHLHLSEDYSNMILRNFTGNKLPLEVHTYLDQLRTMKPKKDSLNDWVAKHYAKKVSYNQQQKQLLYFGHYLLTRATQLTAVIRNLYNPLWDLANIPSGKTVTDLVRAIRTHLYKIHRYRVLIEEYRKKEEVKLSPDDEGGWTEEERLEWVRDQLDTQFLGFKSTSYEDGFLAYLICSVPVDFYAGRKMSLTLLVPPGTAEVVPFVPSSTAPKTTRRNERSSSSSVPGTASASLDLTSDSSSHRTSMEPSNALNIVMTHNIQRSVPLGKRQREHDNDEEIAGLLEESASLKQLIADIKELGSPSCAEEISEHQLRVIEISRDVALLQRARNDAKKQKRLADQNMAKSLTASSNSIVAGLFPPLRANPSPASVVSSALNIDDEDVMSPVVEIPIRVLPQNRDTYRPPTAKPTISKRLDREPLRYGSRSYFDQLMQETFGPYGHAHALSSRYVTKIPVDHDILQEVSDLRSSVQKADDIACIDRWVRLLAESINVQPARYGVPLSLYEQHQIEQSSSSSSSSAAPKERIVVGDSLEESATFVDCSSLLTQYIDSAVDACDDDDKSWHVDAPADFGPMVEEE